MVFACTNNAISLNGWEWCVGQTQQVKSEA